MTMIFTIILVCMGVIAIALTLCWYAFRYEPINFKLSEIDINVTNKRQTQEETSDYIQKNSNSFKQRYNYKDVTLISSYQELNIRQPLLRILHLSDFHLRKDWKGRKLFVFIQSLKVIKPDFVFITGDLVEKNENFSYLVEMLSGFKASIGKFAVFGVHDYYDKTPREFLKNFIKRTKEYERENDVTELVLKLNSIGIQVLQNERISFKCPSGEIEIIGLDDSIVRKTDVKMAFGESKSYLKSGLTSNLMPEFKSDFETDLKFKYKRSNHKYREVFKISNKKIHTLNNENKLIISLTHTPDIDLFVDLLERDVDIVFCGHTHGGQVRLPLIGALLTGCNMKTRYSSGLFYFKKFVLYTTRGLGEGRYSPFRFYCQPEASLINLFIV
jgi:predicted MPP superfamily phosphohydrolase